MHIETRNRSGKTVRQPIAATTVTALKVTVRPALFSDLQGLTQGLSTGLQSELDKLGKRSANEMAARRVLRLAPRPVLLQTGSEDGWSDPKGEFLAAVAAEPVYKLFGKQGLGTTEWPAAAEPSRGSRAGI